MELSIQEIINSSIDYPVVKSPVEEIKKSSENSSCSSESSSSETPTDSSSSSEGDTLASLSHYLKTSLRTKPYDTYATSYLTPVIPSCSLKIHSDDTASHKAEPPPFKNPLRIPSYELQEKRRQQLGQSSRLGKIIPSSKVILNEILKKGPSKDPHLFLFYKARQWCEVNKALAVDAQYPKISPKVIRDKHSSEYRKACRETKKKQGLKDNTRIFKQALIAPFPIPLELVEGIPGHQQKMGNEDPGAKIQKEIKQQKEIREELSKIFDEIGSLLEDSSEGKLPWQFKALKTLKKKKAPSSDRKYRIKRTEYPPRSLDEKIADLRKLAKPPRPEHLETDYLSGIWEPELMTEDFSITPLNYDSRITTEEDGPKIPWERMNDAKIKCKNWLQSTPEL